MNQLAPMGHNNPPNPIAEIVAPFDDYLTEAQALLDGGKVETEGQMKHYDEVTKGVKAAKKAVDTARDAAVEPLNKAWKDEIAFWKPAQDDLDRIIKGLVKAVDGFKQRLAAEKAEAERKAREEAYAAKRAAEEAAALAAANETDIEAQRAAAEAIDAAADAWQHVGDLAADKVKGLRTVTTATVEDYGQAINWIRLNDREALVAFIDDYVAKATRAGVRGITGVTITTDKKAF